MVMMTTAVFVIRGCHVHCGLGRYTCSAALLHSCFRIIGDAHCTCVNTIIIFTTTIIIVIITKIIIVTITNIIIIIIIITTWCGRASQLFEDR